jgi:hypothetical protein
MEELTVAGVGFLLSRFLLADEERKRGRERRGQEGKERRRGPG